MRALAGFGFAAALFAGIAASPARAQDPIYQAYFAGVCTGAPTGALATRCFETGGGGDLSADSENSLNPSQILTANEAAIVRAQRLRAQIDDRVRERRDGEQRPDTTGGFGLFVGGKWANFDRDATRDERGIDGTVRGAALGIDMWLREGLLVGAVIAHELSDGEFDRDAPGVAFLPNENEGSSDSENTTLALFASMAATPELWFDGTVGYGITRYELNRRVVFQESGRVVPQTQVATDADPDGGEVFGGFGATYGTARGAFDLEGFARADWVYTWIERHSETSRAGSGLAQRVSRQTRSSFTTSLGGRVSRAISTSLAVIVPQIRASWVHEFDRDAQDATTRLLLDAAGREFDGEGESPDRDYGLLAIGANLVFPNGWMGFAELEVLVGYADLDRHSLSLGMRREF